jgi:chorismate mutase
LILPVRDPINTAPSAFAKGSIFGFTGHPNALPPRKTKPADLPAKLDALDDKIHDLLMKRADLQETASPAEQAACLRRLAQRHKGELPLAAMTRIWRELMAASATPGRTVHVYAADRAGQFRDLARDLFGSLVVMKSHLSAAAIVHECTDDPLAFGVVPPPESDENARAWWAQLTPSGKTGPRVVATLPLVGATQAAAYVVGTLEPEPSGDDTTLLLLEAGDTLSLTKLQTLLKQGGLDARLLAVSRDSAKSAVRHHLLEVTGFMRPDDSRLGSLMEQRDDAILGVTCVGSYANPLSGGSAP